MPDNFALAEDIAAIADLEQEAHLATPMLKRDLACWAAVAAVAAWGQSAPALRIADKLWHLRAWKPRI